MILQHLERLLIYYLGHDFHSIWKIYHFGIDTRHLNCYTSAFLGQLHADIIIMYFEHDFHIWDMIFTAFGKSAFLG